MKSSHYCPIGGKLYGTYASLHSLEFTYVGCLALSTYLMLVFQVVPSSFYTVALFVLVLVLASVIICLFGGCFETRSVAQFVLELTTYHHKLQVIPLPQAS